MGVVADHSVDIDEQAGKAVHKQEYSTLNEAIEAAGYGVHETIDDARLLAIYGESAGPITNTIVNPQSMPWADFRDSFKQPEIGCKDGSYFTCAIMVSNRRNAGNALSGSVVVLDGDSSVSDAGDVIAGAPDPKLVHQVLCKAGFTHFIYSSHSNITKGHRYRVVLPAAWGTKEELVALVGGLIRLLHKRGVMLANVAENSNIACAWYRPRTTTENEAGYYFAEFTGPKGVSIEALPLPDKAESKPVKAPTVVTTTFRKDSITHIASALKHKADRLGRDMEYPEWQKITMIIHSWDDGNDGLELALQFGEYLGFDRNSMANGGETVLDELLGKWSGYSQNGGIKIATLIQEEMRYGWRWDESMEPAAIAAAEEALSKYTVEKLPDDLFDNEPPPEEFVIDAYVPRGAVSLLVAAGGVGKSLAALHMSICVATGGPFLGCGVSGRKVVFISLEDMKKRIHFRLFHNVRENQRDAVLENFRIMDRYGKPTHMVESVNGAIAVSQVPGKIIELLQNNPPDLIIVDTLIRSHSVDENANAQMATVLVAYEKLAVELNCGVVLLHHIPKQVKGGGTPTARGAGSITDNARSAMTMTHANDDDVSGFMMDDAPFMVAENRLIKVVHSKHNYSAKERNKWFEMTADGRLLPWMPIVDSRCEEEQLYDDIHDWFTMNGSKPICKTQIENQVEDIRPADSKTGKLKYQKALEWAIKNGFGVPANGPNKNAKYFALKSRATPGLQGNSKQTPINL